jgi:DNA-binding transcriptional MerR regulator
MDMQFRPIELARAVGISAATVRMYEREGILPEADRNPSGHRRYRFRHLRALETARVLMQGYGWEHAKRVMRAVHAGQMAEVHTLVDARHAAIDRDRRQLVQTMQAFEVLTSKDERDRQFRLAERMKQPVRVGVAAREAGVPVSTVHFWEEQGLLLPQRDKESNYRLYTASDVRQLQVIVMLRDAGYRFDDIRPVVLDLAQGNPDAALAAMKKRQLEMQRASMECMAATAALWRYLAEFQTCQ